MHYIRFLKNPILVPGARKDHDWTLKCKITITTDLGESFLMEDLPLEHYILDSGDTTHDKKNVMWKGGSRSLDISFKLSCTVDAARQGRMTFPLTFMVVPLGELRRFTKLRDCLPGKRVLRDKTKTGAGDLGLVMPVRSDLIPYTVPPLYVEKKASRTIICDSLWRIKIWEETQDSIARHIWDAGLVLSSLISFLIAKEEPQYPATVLPNLTLILRAKHIKVLELGTGCGIVSITLAHAHDSADIIMTDLKDAQNIAQLNINTNEPPKTGTSLLSYRNLDWSDALPYSVFQTTFNVILVADCTYNPNSVPFLVDTLSRCADKDPEVLICVAMKIRHDSEIIFFQLMQQRHLGVLETLKLDLPVLGLPDNGEQIEVWVFRRGRTSRTLRNNAALVERLSPMPLDEQNWENEEQDKDILTRPDSDFGLDEMRQT